MSDQELRALERRLEAEPADEALFRQYDRALLRAGRTDEVVALRVKRALCDRRWLDHELDPQSGLVRRCQGCQRSVPWVRDAAELERYVATGQPVAGPRALLEAHLRGAVARELAAPAAEPAPGPACFAPAPLEDVVGLTRGCRCLQGVRQAVHLHVELQDTQCEAWARLVAAIDAAALDGRATFDPAQELGQEDWARIVELPPTIGKLTEVRTLHLFGSGLHRLPPEVGRMRSLEELDTYSSYRLHWYPYELTRCQRLARTRVSTRALYGNFKLRPPFPDLTTDRGPAGARGRCSHCDAPSEALRPVWISLRVGTDVLPLLAHVCSEVCAQGLPRPPEGYVPTAHRGGPGVVQPVAGSRG